MALRQDFLLQQYSYPSNPDVIVWDFPLDDTYYNGVIQPTPYGFSDNQHKIDLIVNNIGSLKQFPLCGFGVFKYLNSETTSDVIYNALSNTMKSDGYILEPGALKFLSENDFTIDPNKISNNY